MQVPSDYGYVVASVGVFSMAMIIVSAGVPRARIFKNNDNFWKKPAVQKMSDEYKKHMGCEIDKNGYPDMGNGQLGQHLEFSEWLDFANAQRMHYKYVEEAAPFLACSLATGLIYPRTVAAMVIVNVFGRTLWANAYTKLGSASRYSRGGMLYTFSSLGMFLLTISAGLGAVGQPAAAIVSLKALAGLK